jgi:Tfp pilus assembly protein PilF
LQVLLDRNPSHESAREILAYSYIEDGKRDVAMQVFEDLARKATTPIVRARCQAVLEQARRQTPDMEAYRNTLIEAVKEYGGDATTWLAIAESYRDPQSGYAGLGTDLTGLREAYRNALAHDPDNDQAAIGLIHTSQRLLEFEEAARQFETLLKRRPNRHAWRLGLSNRRPGLIDYYWWTQNYDAALTLAQSALARNDLDDVWRLRYRVALVETLRQSRQDAEALKLLRQWAEPELKSTFWHGVFRSTISGTLGWLVQGEGATGRTFQRWSEALRIEQAPWSQILADEYLRQGENEQAVAIWETLRLSAPDDLRVTLSLIETLRATERYTRASQLILDWLANDPENDDVIDLLVSVLAEARRTEDALELCRNRLLHTFDRQRLQNRIIAVLAQAERFDDCLDYIESLIDEAMGVLTSNHPGKTAPGTVTASPEALLRLPNEPFTMEGLHERITGLRQRLATVLIAAKDYRTAESELNEWLESTRNPDDRFAYLRRLAACSLFQGKGDAAAEAQTRALLLRPDDVSLNNDVAYAWIDRGVRMQEAERMIRYAVSTQPTQTAYLDTYGWLLYKKGQFAEAKKWMLRAVGAVSEADPVILDHLGDCFWRLGERSNAIEYWKAALAALSQRPEEELQTEDRRRVKDVTPEKIRAATEGKDPPVAPLASELPNDDESGQADPQDH